MIKAFIFDLDGTLVQTEILKAISYARAAIELCPQSITEEIVIEAFKEVVGLSRKEVAQRLVERFELEKAARDRMKEFNVSTPWQAFIQVRIRIYESMLSDPQIVHERLCPHNAGLLKWAGRNRYHTALATMSHCSQASRVLQILELRSEFQFIATRDDVKNGKPNPEIYILVARELDVPPNECLVIEDSPSGVKAALAAGMGCIAVTNDFTRASLRASALLDDRWIVESTPELEDVARRFIAERNASKDKAI